MPAGTVTITIAAGSDNGTATCTASRILAVVPPSQLEGDFFQVSLSPDDGTTYYVPLDADGNPIQLRPSYLGSTTLNVDGEVFTKIKVTTSQVQTIERTFTIIVADKLGGLTLYLGDSGTSTSHTRTVGTACTVTDTGKAWTVNEWAGATVTLNSKTMTVASNTATVLTSTAAGWSADPGAAEAAYTLYFAYPIAYIRSVKSAADRVPSMQTGGALRWDQNLGCWEFKITDFSGPLGQMRTAMETERQGHRLADIVYPTWDGTAGYLTGTPRGTTRITPSPAIASTRVVVPTGVAICSDIRAGATDQDEGSDPRWYVGVGNQVWASVRGSPKFQDSGSANAAVTFTDTTMTDTREAWTVNEWVGFTVTAAGQTLLVTSNTANTLTGTGTWSGAGDPADGSAWEMHRSVLTITSATQVSGMASISIYESATKTYRRIYACGASASAETLLSFIGSSSTIPWLSQDDGAWHTAQAIGPVNVSAESICSCRAWGYPTGTTAIVDSEVLFIAHLGGRIDIFYPVFTGAYGKQFQITVLGNHTQFLASHFDDAENQGISMISDGRLVMMYWPKTTKPSFRPISDLPTLFCGCMYQNYPTVTDGGLAIWQVRGSERRRLDLPSNLLLDYNIRNTKTYRASIRFLQSAGDLLLAGLQITDGTNYILMLMAYNDAVGQWRVLWTYDGGTSASDFLGSYLATTHAPVNLTGADKHLMIAYKVGTNSLVDTIQMPRGIVGQTGADDSFNAVDLWGLPEFDGGEPTLTGTMFGYRMLSYASEGTTPTIAIYDSMDGAAYATGAGMTVSPNKGWNSTEALLGSGAGESFIRCAIYFSSPDSSGPGHCEIHSFSYLFLKRGPTRLTWLIPLDTQKWMRDNTKTVSQLLTQLGYSRNRKIGSTAAITNVMATDTVVLKDFDLENPSDPVTAPIGYTLVELEAPI